MLRAVRDAFGTKRLASSDLSAAVVKRNRREMPDAMFFAADPADAPLPDTWDLVIGSEVIEHIKDYLAALRHLRTMCTEHLIVTVPRSRIFPIELAMGHHQHFSADGMHTALRRSGFEPLVAWRLGFPWHTAYKHLINIAPEASMQRFGHGAYSFTDKLVARVLTALFYVNSKHAGMQLIVLVRAV